MWTTETNDQQAEAEFLTLLLVRTVATTAPGDALRSAIAHVMATWQEWMANVGETSLTLDLETLPEDDPTVNDLLHQLSAIDEDVDPDGYRAVDDQLAKFELVLRDEYLALSQHELAHFWFWLWAEGAGQDGDRWHEGLKAARAAAAADPFVMPPVRSSWSGIDRLAGSLASSIVQEQLDALSPTELEDFLKRP